MTTGLKAMFLDMLAGWPGLLIPALTLLAIVGGAKRFRELRRGFREREALSEFRKASDEVALDVGKSLGGIYGKSAAEALTPDNQTAELYDPAAFQDAERTRRAAKRIRFGGWRRLWRRIRHLVLEIRKAKI